MASRRRAQVKLGGTQGKGAPQRDDQAGRSSAQAHRRDLYCPKPSPDIDGRASDVPDQHLVAPRVPGTWDRPGRRFGSAEVRYLVPAKAGIDPGRVGRSSAGLISLPSSRRARQTRLLTVPIGAPQTAAAAS